MNQRRIRRGTTIIELCVAAALLAAALSVVVSMLGVVARQRRSAELRARALEEADNLLERLTAEPWESITPEQIANLGLAAKVAESLPDGELRIDVTSAPERSTTKRIDLSVAWRPAVGRPANHVRLTTWVERRTAP
jgi:Tfp pilus assembly protein PilV